MDVLIKQLNKNLKGILEEYKQKVENLSDKQIDKLSIAILDINSIDELSKYLN